VPMILHYVQLMTLPSRYFLPH